MLYRFVNLDWGVLPLCQALVEVKGMCLRL